MADENKQDIKFNKWQVAGAIIAVVALLSIPLFVHFTAGALSNKGQWGDFFGGTLNPTLTFLTFLGLLYTIILQKNELGLSRKELELTREEVAKSATALNAQNDSMKQQRFENTLFNMISVFNQIIDQMDVGSRENPTRGRDCFSYINNDLRIAVSNFEYQKEGNLDDAYEAVYSNYASDLGHYFRMLYNIFKFIKESDYSNPIYAKILRAQLSNQELLILYYNCLSPYGEKFKKLAIEFELFDNLQLDTLIRSAHYDLMDKRAFGDNQTKLQEIVSE